MQEPGGRSNVRAGQNLASGSLEKPRPVSTLRSRGPRHLGGGEPEVLTDLVLFLRQFQVRGTTSITEGMVYWALEKLLGPEGDSWVYQESRMGGRHLLGGAVIDFIVYVGNLSIGIRVQTYRFHMNADPRQKAHDQSQLWALSDPRTIIIDIFEQDFIDDMTGQAVIRVVHEAITGQQRINPLASGFVAGTG
jgi:hypothetical protein